MIGCDMRRLAVGIAAGLLIWGCGTSDDSVSPVTARSTATSTVVTQAPTSIHSVDPAEVEWMGEVCRGSGRYWWSVFDIGPEDDADREVVLGEAIDSLSAYLDEVGPPPSGLPAPLREAWESYRDDVEGFAASATPPAGSGDVLLEDIFGGVLGLEASEAGGPEDADVAGLPEPCTELVNLVFGEKWRCPIPDGEGTTLSLEPCPGGEMI